MEDARIWEFERSLWTASPEHYQASIDDQCVMALPAPPFILTGQQSVEAVSNTPRWQQVELTDRQVMRPQEGLIVIGYTAHAERGEERYTAHCTSTYRRLGHDDWKVVQHSQVVALTSHGA